MTQSSRPLPGELPRVEPFQKREPHHRQTVLRFVALRLVKLLQHRLGNIAKPSLCDGEHAPPRVNGTAVFPGGVVLGVKLYFGRRMHRRVRSREHAPAPVIVPEEKQRAGAGR